MQGRRNDEARLVHPGNTSTDDIDSKDATTSSSPSVVTQP